MLRKLSLLLIVSVIIIGLMSLVGSDLTTDLVSYYKLDETSGDVVDSYGTNTGTNVGATRGVEGKLDNAFDFDGSNDWVYLGNDSSLGFEYDEPFSVSFWMNFTDTGQRVIVSKSANINHVAKGWSIFTYLGWIYFQLNSGTSYGDNELQISITPLTTFNDGNWKHVVITYDGSSDASGVTFYINNTSYALAADQNTLSATIINIENTTIGATAVPELFWLGRIDELGIWSKELNSTEVAELWNDGDGYNDFLVVDTCTCAGAGNDWEIDMSDYCNITTACDLTTGTLSFTGAGYCNCNASVDTTNLGDPGSTGILYIQDSCLITID